MAGCAADGATRQEALANTEIVIAEWLETARELGRPIPEPKGRLLFPMIRWEKGSSFGSGVSGLGVMMLVQRLRAVHRAKLLGPCGIFPCVGALDEDADRLLGEAFGKIDWTATPMQGGLADTRSLKRDSHDADSTCLLHGRGYCFSKA